MDRLAHALQYVRGYGLRIALVVQNRAQIMDVYGSYAASDVFDNVGCEMVYGTGDEKLAEQLEKRLGDATVGVVTQNRPRWFAWAQPSRQHEAEHPHRRPLMLRQEILQMPSDEQIILRPGMKPIRAKKVRWYQEPAFLERRRDPPKIPELVVEISWMMALSIWRVAGPGPAVRPSRLSVLMSDRGRYSRLTIRENPPTPIGTDRPASAHDGGDGWCRALSMTPFSAARCTSGQTRRLARRLAVDPLLQPARSATIEANFVHGVVVAWPADGSDDRWLMLPSGRRAVATDPVLLAWRKAIHQLRRDPPHPLDSLVHHDPGMLQGNVERPPFDTSWAGDSSGCAARWTSGMARWNSRTLPLRNRSTRSNRATAVSFSGW